MRRFGPLHAYRGDLIIGDPGRRHLLLRPATLAYLDDTETRREAPWAEVDAVQLTLKTTRFRFPGFVSGVFASVFVALTENSPDFGSEDGELVLTMDAVSHTLPLSRHHLGGYWQRSVAATQHLLDRLIADPSERQQLEHPDRVVSLVARAARG